MNGATHVPAATAGVVAPDPLTADRREVKCLVRPGATEALVAWLDARLGRHRFGPERPLAQGTRHHVTTVYFDTQERDVFEAAVSGRAPVKLRAREYYDIYASLAEVASDPGQLLRYVPTTWLEIKRRAGERTGKQRIALAKHEIPALLAGGELTADNLARHRPAPAEVPVQREIEALCRDLRAPLRADCLVNCRRVAWQDQDRTLRITLDRELAYFAPMPDLWSPAPLVRQRLGTALDSPEHAVVELKLTAELPLWLEQGLDAFATPSPEFSKFVAASRAVWGE